MILPLDKTARIPRHMKKGRGGHQQPSPETEPADRFLFPGHASSALLTAANPPQQYELGHVDHAQVWKPLRRDRTIPFHHLFRRHFRIRSIARDWHQTSLDEPCHALPASEAGKHRYLH